VGVVNYKHYGTPSRFILLLYFGAMKTHPCTIDKCCKKHIHTKTAVTTFARNDVIRVGKKIEENKKGFVKIFLLIAGLICATT
jgi:hypothetical protein